MAEVRTRVARAIDALIDGEGDLAFGVLEGLAFNRQEDAVSPASPRFTWSRVAQPVRPELWALLPADDARLGQLDRRREEMERTVPELVNRAIVARRRRIDSDPPVELLPDDGEA